jgi:hypothetical protein
MLFSVGTPVSSTNKTDRYDITEILMLISTDFIGSCKSNYLAITTITALYKWNVMVSHCGNINAFIANDITFCKRFFKQILMKGNAIIFIF